MHLVITIRSNVQIKGNQLSIDPGGTPVALSSQFPLVSAKGKFKGQKTLKEKAPSRNTQTKRHRSESRS